RLWSGRPIIGSPARVTGLFSPRVLRFVRNPGARRGNRRDIVEEVVDLILPVLNEAPAIPWALGRLPSGWDAIVVDNGSTDGSAAIAGALGAEVVQEPRRGFGAACWAGLRAATADVVCFMDC